jgi:hypothetical protein
LLTPFRSSSDGAGGCAKTPAEWGLLVAVGAHAAGVVVALIRVVAWGSSTHARIESRINALEAKVDNDIAGRRIVAEMRADIAAIKATLVEVKEHVHMLEGRAFAGPDRR